MEEKFNEATFQRPEGDRIIDAPLVTIDVLFFIEQIKKEKPWKDSDRNAITVFKTNSMRIVLIALHGGALMSKHSVDGMVSIQMLDGKMKLNTNEQSVVLRTGQILVLHDGIPHSIEAIEESIFLLTLSRMDCSEQSELLATHNFNRGVNNITDY